MFTLVFYYQLTRDRPTWSILESFFFLFLALLRYPPAGGYPAAQLQPGQVLQVTQKGEFDV